MSLPTTTRGILAAAAIAGCSGGSKDPADSAVQEQRYTVCADDYTKTELVSFLDGNLVIVGSHVEEGAGAGEIVGWLAASLLLNGLNLSNLRYEPSFSGGTYEISSGDAALGFTLFFVEDFGDHAAGDVVPYNLFDVSSYVRNLEVTDYDPWTGEVEYDYDRGPAWDLIDGDIDIDIDSDDPTDFRVRVRIRGELFAFEAFSEGTRFGQSPRDEDELHVVMTTTRAPLLEVHDQFLAGEYGFRYTGTRYDSVYYGIEQELTDSLFLMGSDGGDGYVWTGDYASTVIKAPTTLYQSGFVSNLEQNYTEYYCDEALAERVGVAHHRLDLLGGEFVFEDGSSVPYGLGPF